MVVGMRRTTRVFGVVKSGDGARILRSGRKLYSDHSDEVGKSKKIYSGRVDWLKLLDEDYRNKDVTELTSSHVGYIRTEAQPEVRNGAYDSLAGLERAREKKIVKVYERKRKRFEEDVKSDGSNNQGKGRVDERMFVNHYVRRTRTRKAGDTGSMRRPGLIVKLTSRGSVGWLARFLNSVLGYLMRHKVKLSKLHEFLCSNPIGTIFETQGLQFVQKCSGTSGPGYCKINGVTQFAPLFSVDFAAVPACFIYVHLSMFLRSEKMVISFLVNIRSNTVDEALDNISETIFRTTSGVHISGNNFRSHVVNRICKKGIVHSPPQGRQVGCHRMNLRSGFSSSKIRGKRSAPRSRGRSCISVGDPFVYSKSCVPTSDSIKINDDVKLFESLEADLSCKRFNEGPLTGLIEQLKNSPLGCSNSDLHSQSSSNKKARNEGSGECVRNDSVAKFDSPLRREFPDVTSCAANILVIDHDKCYRLKGASIMLESSLSGSCSIVVKKDGITKYSHVAEMVMKPCTFNRATLDIIWVVNSECKLEFPTREDWSIFKDLYKVCLSMNLTASSDKIIPVPGVRIVSNYENTVTARYSRPDAYIIHGGSEVSRVLAKTSASYDIDLEDEEWLANYNEEMQRRNECHNIISPDALEVMIDAIEKALYINPGDHLDGRFKADGCSELVNKEVVEVVYNYWSKKRKQKSSTLVRILQAYKPKQVLEASGPVMRKKRSFKRYASQNGRGNRFLIDGEPLTLMNVEAAKDQATIYAERATHLRIRAQTLMEKADMATYKAAIAVKIAQAANNATAPGTAASMFLI